MDKVEPMELPSEGIVEIELDVKGNVMPGKHDKKIIIDADTIVFASCSVCEYEVQVLGEAFLSKEEMAEARDMKTWDEESFTYRDIDVSQALVHAEEKLQLILDGIGGKLENVELHFTGGRSSFRYDLLKEAFPNDEEMHYKFKRKKKSAPCGLQELKELMCTRHEGQIWYEWEADDVVVLLKKLHEDNSILCAVDKDVLKNTIGKHWNYYEAGYLANPIIMKWDEFDEDEANYNQYLQVIVGDKSDNVPGLKGIGPAKAAKFIEVGMSQSELWEGVIAAYNKHCKYGEAEEMAILNMRLVNMHQLYEMPNLEYNIDLWSPEKNND